MRRSAHVCLVTIFLCGLAAITVSASAADGFSPIFDGKSLAGWEGKPGYWSIEDGAITGQTTKEHPTEKCTYLIWRGGKPGDFELRAQFKLIVGNSGIQIRGRELPDFDMAGYQADMCTEGLWYGSLFHTVRGQLTLRGQDVLIDQNSRKTVTMLGDPAALLKHVKQGDWNDYRIVAKGDEFTLSINDVVMSHTIDRQQDKAARDGLIALQIHPGPPMKVQYKNLRIKTL